MQRSVLLAFLLFAGRPALAAESVDYVRDIRPILKAHCYACHGALQQKGRLRLDTAGAARKGGRHGPAVAAGRPAESLLVERVSSDEGGGRMPPEGVPLTKAQIGLLETWVRQGAKAPAGEKPEEDPRRHWAFRPPARATPPRVKDAGWAGGSIDAFIGAGHARHGLRPNPPVDRDALLRRVYLDLIGLPPTAEEVRAFRADPSIDAYERVVDRLLASPRHGERWGRHWMDVWRYSDWYGRRAVPDVWNSAPQVWRWRDWIVRSLADDKGYDRMVEEMLAADEIAPGDDEAAVATGFLARNWYALNPNQWMRDIVEHTGKAFLGLTMNCAHCHDHKYDPITQQEYFRFRAFFEPLQLRQDRVAGEPDPGPFQKYDYGVLRKVVLIGRVGTYDERPDAKTYPYRLCDERNRGKDEPPVPPGAPAFLRGDRLKIEPVELPREAWYPGSKPFVRREETEARERAVGAARAALSKAAVMKDQAALQRAEAGLATAEAELRSIQARIAADEFRTPKGPGDARLARAASKAEGVSALRAAEEKRLKADQSLAAVRRPGGAAAAVQAAEKECLAAKTAVEAARKALAAESTAYAPLSPLYPATSSGRRRALARWITARDNPLAARVAVNHIWKGHFGRPLVETVFDLGRNGKSPSHPELLDWLAVEFVESGWSMKHLHRLIVTSSTYRMQSGVGTNRASLAADPDNRWIWRFDRRRMEAEVVRDSVLHAAGELDASMGGPPLDNAAGETSRRRSLYFGTYPEDGGHPKFLTLFDAPDPCDCYRRSETIVPQQALALTNSRLSLDQSRLLARKLAAGLAGVEQDEDGAFVVAAFEQVLSRAPSAEELALCRAFLVRQAELYRKGVPKTSKTAGSVESPAAAPGMRARESLVRTLFNHHDFLAVR